MTPLRAIVADDSVVIRQGVARILAEGGFRITAEARDANELLEAVATEPPHLAVVDIRMPPGGNAGLDAALTIRERFPTVGVLSSRSSSSPSTPCGCSGQALIAWATC